MALDDTFRHRDSISKARRVRTPEGARFFGLPIGSIIPNGRVGNLRRKHGDFKVNHMLAFEQGQRKTANRRIGGVELTDKEEKFLQRAHKPKKAKSKISVKPVGEGYAVFIDGKQQGPVHMDRSSADVLARDSRAIQRLNRGGLYG